MKVAKNILFVFGYIFQYLMPILLIGIVIPFTHGTIKAGLTGTGIIALCLVTALIYGKIKQKIDKHLKGALKGILLSIFPITIWLILGIGIKRVMSFVSLLVDYWWIAFLFIILGRVCYIIAEILSAGEDVTNG